MRVWLPLSIMLATVMPVINPSEVEPRIIYVTLGRLIACHKGDVDQELCKRECLKKSLPFYLCVGDVCHCSDRPNTCTDEDKKSCQEECAKQGKSGVCLYKGLCKCEAAPCGPNDPDGFACLKHCRRENKTSGVCDSSNGAKICICLSKGDSGPCKKDDPDHKKCQEECVNQGHKYFLCIGDVCHCSPDPFTCDEKDKQECKDKCAKENKEGVCHSKGNCTCEAKSTAPCKNDPDSKLCQEVCEKKGMKYYLCVGDVCHCKPDPFPCEEKDKQDCKDKCAKENKEGICHHKGNCTCQPKSCGPDDPNGFSCMEYCKSEGKAGGFCEDSGGSKICVCYSKDEEEPCKKGDPKHQLCRELCLKKDKKFFLCKDGICICSTTPFPCDEKEKEDCKKKCPKDKDPVCHFQGNCTCEPIPCGPEDDKGFSCKEHCKRQNKTSGVCQIKDGVKVCVCLDDGDTGPCKKGDPDQQLCKEKCLKENMNYYRCDGETCLCAPNPFPCNQTEKDACKEKCAKENKAGVCLFTGNCICEPFPCGPDDPLGISCAAHCKRENFTTGVCEVKNGEKICTCYGPDDLRPCKKGDPDHKLCKEECLKQNKPYYRCEGDTCRCSAEPFPCTDQEKTACEEKCKKDNMVGICHSTNNCTCEHIPCGPNDPDGFWCLASCKRQNYNNTAICEVKDGKKVCKCLSPGEVGPCKNDPDQKLCMKKCLEEKMDRYRCVGEKCECSPAEQGPCKNDPDQKLCMKYCLEQGKDRYRCKGDNCECSKSGPTPCTDKEKNDCYMHCFEQKTSGKCVASGQCVCDPIYCGWGDDSTGEKCLAFCVSLGMGFKHSACSDGKGNRVCTCISIDKVFCPQPCVMFPGCQCPRPILPEEDNGLCGPDDWTGYNCFQSCQKRYFENSKCQDEYPRCRCTFPISYEVCGKHDKELHLCKQYCAEKNKRFYRCEGGRCQCSNVAWG